MLTKLKRVICRTSGTKSAKIRAFTVSFGVHSLRSRECGLYEASDLLLGDHLTEKSDAVKWVDVSLPHKRSHRLKDHKVLEDVAKRDPASEDIFQDSLLDNHYPRRPSNLEGVCLYDSIANYDYSGTDSNGDRKYRKLRKPRLPNHRLFDPERRPDRSLLLFSDTPLCSIQRRK